MARLFSIYNTFMAPSGYIVLKEPIVNNGKNYYKVWSPFWDIVINKGFEDIPIEEKKDNKKWTWYGIYNNEILFYIGADKVINFFEYKTKPKNKDILSFNRSKKNAKVQKKTSNNRSNAV